MAIYRSRRENRAEPPPGPSMPPVGNRQNLENQNQAAWRTVIKKGGAGERLVGLHLVSSGD